MAQDVKPILLNLGCGWDKREGWINIDAFPNCEPDIIWDLNLIPWPWMDNSVDAITAWHVFEHLHNWWDAFVECGRILKPRGTLDVRVPDASSDSSLTYRDHLNVFNKQSFDGIINRSGRNLAGNPVNAWFENQSRVPLRMIQFAQIPFDKYNWMPQFLLRFCADHLRNFIWEQRFLFLKEVI